VPCNAGLRPLRAIIPPKSAPCADVAAHAGVRSVVYQRAATQLPAFAAQIRDVLASLTADESEG
jgi:hypothetical protein